MLKNLFIFIANFSKSDEPIFKSSSLIQKSILVLTKQIGDTLLAQMVTSNMIMNMESEMKLSQLMEAVN